MNCVLKTQHRRTTAPERWQRAKFLLTPFWSLFSSIPPFQSLKPLSSILLLAYQRSRVLVDFHLSHQGSEVQPFGEVSARWRRLGFASSKEKKGGSLRGNRTLPSRQAVDVSTALLIWNCWRIFFSLVNSCCPEPLRVPPWAWAQSSQIFFNILNFLNILFRLVCLILLANDQILIK